MDFEAPLGRTTVSKLGLKLALLATVVPVTALLAFGELLAASEREALARAQDARARTWAVALEAALGAPLVAEDHDRAAEIFRSLVRREPDVAFAYVLDTDGRRLAVYDRQAAEVSALSPSGVAVQRLDVVREGLRRGTVVVALNLAGVETTFASRRADLLQTSLAVGLGTALCLLWVLRRQSFCPCCAVPRVPRVILGGVSWRRPFVACGATSSVTSRAHSTRHG